MTEPLYPRLILDVLANVRYPGNGKNIVELEMVTGDDLRIDGRHVELSLHFSKPTDPFAASLVKSVQAALKTFIAPDVEATVNTLFPSMAEKAQEAPVLPGVKNIIAVSSGKGGVGKSTVAANLAVALAREGYRVGLLDADIFGPSVPKMFGVEDEPVYMSETPDGRRLIEPLERYGVKILSIGFLVEKDAAVLWRGSMASNALKQLITEANWGELDYFLLDLPPGTSDIHLTVVQTVALTGAVVVTTLRRWPSPMHARASLCFRAKRWECPSSVSSKTWHGLPLSSTPTNAITSSDAKGAWLWPANSACAS